MEIIMIPQPVSAPALTSEDLQERHNVTREVANFCRQELRTHLETLAPLFRPRRVLGEYIEGNGRESVADAQRNFTELRDAFARLRGSPFELRPDLSSPIESPATQMQLYEWEYVHDARAGRDRRPITVTAPLTWVLTYPSLYSLSMMRLAATGRQERNYEAVHAFVLRACLLRLLFEKQSGLKTLLEGLRYKVEFRKLPELRDLPLVTVSAPVSTFRPSDDLVLSATGLSGRAVFQEVLDLESAARLRDPFQERIAAILRGESAAASRAE
jgi:hypothetical protein